MAIQEEVIIVLNAETGKYEAQIKGATRATDQLGDSIDDVEGNTDIRELRNIKLANQLLKVKRKQKQERDEKQAMLQQQMQAASQLKSQQMAAQTAMQKSQSEMQAKMQMKQAEIAFEIEKMKNQAQLKSMLMAEEFSYNQQLNGMDAEALATREAGREEAKSGRISQQNSEQSKLINQRKNNLPPQRFESNEDSLDGFDLAEFDPR